MGEGSLLAVNPLDGEPLTPGASTNLLGGEPCYSHVTGPEQGNHAPRHCGLPDAWPALEQESHVDAVVKGPA
jgi:hypothetical protein